MKTVDDVVQLWNFKKDKLVAEFQVQETAKKVFPKTSFSNLAPGSRTQFVRFSPDGSTVVASAGQKIYVLRARNLIELPAIPLVAPPSESHNFQGKTITTEPRVTSLEVSPIGNILAVLWVQGLIYGSGILRRFIPAASTSR